MISLMLSSFSMLLTSIMANSTTSTSRQTPFFNRLRKRNWAPEKTNQFDPFLQARAQARAHQFLTPKEHGFDMPTFLKYGSTGRPPGKSHLRHSLKEFTNFSEFPPPPFDIFFIDLNNYNRNNNNYSIIYYNGGIVDDNKDEDIKDGGLYGTRCIGRVGNNSNTNVVGHRSNRIDTWLTDRIEPNRCNYKYKFNIDGISTTTTTNPANYKTSTEGIPNENGEDAEAAAGLSEWFANLFESNRCNSISNNNSNSNTIIFLFKLISLYLIITKSFSSKQFTKEQKEKQHHHHHQQQQQQHYHGKRRHQFHLEQQQKHQHFKQEQHNMERMVTSIVLKLSLVAWDMWTYRNGF